jgi:hypothetical protein
MPEFLGYKSDESQPIDWAALSGELGEKIDTAIGTRGREREAFASVSQQNEDLINSYEVGQNQTMNDLILDGANSGRDQIWKWNKMANDGEMTRSEFTKRQNALTSNWGSLANAAKTFDERTMKTLARQQPDENGVINGSGLELYINKQHSEIADLKNKNVYINPESGTVYLAQYDDDGKMVSQRDVRQMNNPGNMLDNRVNLTTSVKAGTADWDEWSTFKEGVRGSSSTITDVRNNPSFVSAKLALVDSILTNPRSIASVLVDNSDGDYQFYTLGEDGNRDKLDTKLQTALGKARRVAEASGVELDEQMFLEDTEKLMIETARDDTGVFQPQITDDQLEAARGYVSNEIEVQLGHEEKGTVKRAPRYYGTGGNETTPKNEGDYALYTEISDAWKMSKQDPDRSANLLTNATGGRYRFEWEGGGLTVYSNKTETESIPGEVKGTEIEREVPVVIAQGVKSLRSLSPYFFGYGTGSKGVRDSFTEYDAQRKRAKAAGIGKKKSKQKPKSTSIKRSDVDAAAKAAGYTYKEYVKLLRENGVKITH